MNGDALAPAPPDPSLWGGTLRDPIVRRASLPGDVAVDVAIVGAGYTGLWTAFYLLGLDPALRVVVVEREHAGYGASGRNGGWCIGELAADHAKLARAASSQRATALMRAMFDAVDEVGRVVAAQGIDCHYRKGGTIRLARNGAHETRQRQEVRHMHSLGFDEDDVRLLDAAEATTALAATNVRGALFFAHTAALHPARLVRGLADAVESRGGTIHEGTAALRIEPNRVVTAHGTITADVVIRATEGYTRDLRRQRRRLVPLYSLMIATEPISGATWSEIGLHDRATFADDRHLVIYGQRTADGRIAFGGRGAPYGFGSRIDPSIEQRSSAHDLIAGTLRELLPQVRGVAITHRWGGVLGVPRDWFPTVAFDPSTGVGHAGGYVGEGVAAANLAGRTLADLVVGESTERTAYPWVDHRSRRWELEPLRWLAVNGALRVMASADSVEARTNRPARRAGLMYRLIK